MAIDPMMLGHLKDVAPLSPDERKRLFDSMQTDRDRRHFESIVSRAEQMRSPHAPRGGLMQAYQEIVWEFGNEVVNRVEARDLRRLAERVQERSRLPDRDQPRMR